jgi:hypothetical protein
MVALPKGTRICRPRATAKAIDLLAGPLIISDGAGAGQIAGSRKERRDARTAR